MPRAPRTSPPPSAPAGDDSDPAGDGTVDATDDLAGDGTAADGSAGVNSVEIGARVLRALMTAGRPVPLRTVTAATGFPRAKAHRYLSSLVRAGLVRQDAVTGHYALGPLSLELGLAAMGQLDRDGIARAALAALGEDLHATVGLCGWGSAGAVVLSVHAAPDALFVGMRTGAVLPLTRSATGQVFIGWLPEAALAPVLARESPRPTAADVAAIRRSVRADGIAFAPDTVVPGLSGLAVPVFDYTGGIVFVLALIWPSERFERGADSPMARTLKRHAAALSDRLGWRPAAAAAD